jgi:hypothetical protein
MSSWTTGDLTTSRVSSCVTRVLMPRTSSRLPPWPSSFARFRRASAKSGSRVFTDDHTLRFQTAALFSTSWTTPDFALVLTFTNAKHADGYSSSESPSNRPAHCVVSSPRTQTGKAHWLSSCLRIRQRLLCHRSRDADRGGDSGDMTVWANETLDRMTSSAVSRMFQLPRQWRAPRHRSALRSAQ